MGVLAEYLKAEGTTIKAERAKRQKVLKEWVDSLNELFRQIQEWLSLSGPISRPLLPRHDTTPRRKS
jgi:hypothetical protein